VLVFGDPIQEEALNTSLLVVLAAAIGLIVNTITILGVAWRGGQLLGRLQQVVDTLGTEVTRLRDWRHDHDNVEQRVKYLEHEVQQLREAGHA
jgi:hypothetical protein